MQKLSIILGLLYLVICPPVQAFEKTPSIEDITFYTENYPPANYLVNDELKGITVDTLKVMWQYLNIAEPEIFLVPWVRGYRFTLEKSNTALFTMSKTQPRESLFKWVGPIFHSTHVLMAKKSKQYNFSSLGQVFYHTVASVQGDVSEISLQQVGFPASNIAKVSELKQAFLMLQSGRVDMMVASIHGFAHIADKYNFDISEYEQVWQVNKTGNYLAFNTNTPDEIVAAYQNAFTKTEQQRIAIKKKYLLPLAEY